MCSIINQYLFFIMINNLFVKGFMFTFYFGFIDPRAWCLIRSFFIDEIKIKSQIF